MQKTIWKFVIPFAGGDVDVEFPAGTEILSVKVHDGGLRAWGLVEMGRGGMETRTFRIFATGRKFDDEDLSYITTVVLKDETVWHIFEVLK